MVVVVGILLFVTGILAYASGLSVASLIWAGITAYVMWFDSSSRDEVNWETIWAIAAVVVAVFALGLSVNQLAPQG